MPENTNPDVIYLEADSEITEAIDKLKASTGDEVRIAVPARSAMLQSAINLKLLKKAASSSHKKLVLVSADKATMSLAAGLGLMVANNVKAEAAVPAIGSLPPETNREPVVIEQEQPPDARQASDSKNSGSNKSNGSFEKKHISLSDDEPLEDKKSEELNQPPVKGKRNSKEPKVPNFMGLNRKIGIAVIAFAVFLLLVLAYVFLPTAKAILIAKAQKTPVNVKFTLDAGTRKSDFENGIVAANQVSATKSLSAQFAATGQKDVGQKASGSVAISNCSTNNSFTMPAGTTFSSNGKNFTLGSSVSVPGASFSSGQCSQPGKANGNITASQNGDSYNVSNATFAISGYDGLVNAKGTTSGGVSKIATVVTQDDLDKAQKTMIEQANQSAQQELSGKASKDEKIFDGTFTTTVSNVSSSAPVNSENSGGTISAQVKYTELAASSSDLDKLFEVQTKTQIPGGNQLYQSGAGDAQYKVTKLDNADKATMGATSNAFYGQTIDTNTVAKSISGKSKKSAIDIVQPQYSQVEGVLVESTPALTPNLPFFANRITVEIRVKTD